MTITRAAIFVALFLFSPASPLFAQDVTLTSRDGAVEIVGTLLGFDGEFYRVQTVYGELTVDGTGVFCMGPGCPNLTHYVAEITISGSATMGEVMMPALIQAFALRNGYRVRHQKNDAGLVEFELSQAGTGTQLARFAFHASNSDEGFADLLADEADIAMSHREIRPFEVKRGYDAGLGDMSASNRSRVLALDGMVPVVAAGNPVHEVSPLQLAQIFAGDITNWSILGGPDAPIGLHLLTKRSGLTQAIEDQLLAPAKLTISPDITRYAMNKDLLKGLKHDPFGVGIVSFSETGDLQPLTLTGACGFAMTASRRSIKTEDYPLTAPMFLYFPARRLPKLAREFLTFTRSPAAQIVIRRAGFVDQDPEEVSISLQGDRFANAISIAGDDVPLTELQRMVKTLAPMKRLSTSFRFQAGSSRLDAQSRSNVHQLAHALEAGTYDARRLLFVGFSDGDGPAKGNQEIAGKRAEAVRTAVLGAAETANLDRITLDVAAFGEALPMACDDSAWGRQVNRRVEVWVR